MAMLETYLDLLDLGFFEAQFAFEGLADADVWQRPAEGLLSIGELAGHIAYWYAGRFGGEGDGQGHPNLATCAIQSPLIDPRFGYFPNILAELPTDAQRAMTAAQVWAELQRMHQEVSAILRERQPDLESAGTGWPAHFNYRETLKYTIFHISYHVGQMYSVRHLRGDTPPDN